MSRQGLVWSRARVERDWALLPPEGVAESVLPEWTSTVAKILAAPAMGAGFAQYDLTIAPGGGTQQALAENVEAFLFVLEGAVSCDLNGSGRKFTKGGFAYMRPGSRFMVNADQPTKLLWLKKRYVPFGSNKPHDIVGNENELPGETYMGFEGLILKTLLPADHVLDMAMNIFTFPLGASLPVIETH